MPKVRVSLIFSFASLLLLTVCAASAQDNAAPAGSDDQSVTTLKVNVDVVQLFFNVKDKKGGLIPNLTKNDLQIFEDGKQQSIRYFAAESDLPLTLGILID